jgi:sugar lactone lactonase YvrE
VTTLSKVLTSSKRNLLFTLASSLLLVMSSSMVPISHAYLVNAQPASIEVPEPSFSTSNPSCYDSTPTQGSQCNPNGIAFDKSGNLWVADSENSRVLEYKAPLVMGEPASIVLGQPTFNTNSNNNFCSASPTCMFSPGGLAFDKKGNLWVSDSAGSRILKFNHPFSTGEAASMVLGQPDLFTIGGTTSATGLYGPEGMAFDKSGNLYVADDVNNRVVRYSAPLSNDESASLVIGQPDFVSNTCTATPPTSQGFCSPNSVSLDAAGNLWVSDLQNQRVLRFNSPLSTHEAASLVLGWSDFSTRKVGGCPLPPSTLLTFCGPDSMVFDNAGNVWVSDYAYDRIIRFNAPFSNGESPSLLLGQADFTTVYCPSGPSSTCVGGITGLAYDPAGDLWAADHSYDRVMEYSRFNNGEIASAVLGQTGFTTSTCAASQSGLCGPASVSFDKSGNLWAADGHNNRVVRFSSPISSGGSESLVLGQSSFTASGCATTQTGLCFPTDTAFDSSGNLWVADANNNRVIRFNAPFTIGESASIVLGQSTFTTNTCATSASGLCGPSGIAFDKSGNLWVVDLSNNRVLRFNAPFSNGESASVVLGQTSFTTKASATTRGGLTFPVSLTFDKSGNMWVADVGNDRVLEYKPSFTNGKLASLVIGQGSFTTTGCAANSGLCNPDGVAFDAVGNLWVSDSVNGREISYSPVFYNGEFTYTEVGEPNIAATGCGTTQTRLCNPANIVFDKSGDLWVADFSNNRIVEFT